MAMLPQPATLLAACLARGATPWKSEIIVLAKLVVPAIEKETSSDFAV
jgi:hypothetical protein